MSKPVRRQGSAVYYARRVVPKDLRDRLGCAQIWKTLNEREFERAKALERRQQVVWDDLFDSLRNEREAARQQHAAQARPWEPFASEEEQEHCDAVQRVWDDLVDDIQADPVLKARHELAATVRAQNEKYELEALIAEEAAAKGRAEPIGTPLLDVVDRWASTKKPDRKTVDRMKQVVSWFEDAMGRIPVEAIRPEDVLTWTEKLLSSGIDPANARTKLANLNTLLRFAVFKARIIKANPAAGLSVEVKKDPEDDVQPFDLPALQAIFGSPIYTHDERPDAGSGEAAYWLPVLALFTGARLNELGQLRPKDILKEPYVDREGITREAWCIRIVADKADGLKLKNRWSARRFPVHPELIRLGFLDYVETARAKGQARIFPDLRPDTYGHVTGNWSKWFGRYLRGTCKVADKRMRFHSFRHAFKDYVREAEIAEDVNDAITGHKGQSVARRYGSSLKYPLRPLVNAMAEYRPTALKLPAPPPAFRPSNMTADGRRVAARVGRSVFTPRVSQQRGTGLASKPRFGDDVGSPDLHGRRYPQDRDEAGIALSPLDLAHVRAVDPCSMGERFLRHAEALTPHADRVA